MKVTDIARICIGILALAGLLCSPVSSAEKAESNRINSLDTKAGTHQVTVSVEGPWAYADDPAHPGRIVLIAPQDRVGHFPPAATSAHAEAHLKLYSTLDINNRVSPAAPTCTISAFEPHFATDLLKTIVDPAVKKGRYVLSLPAPDSCQDSVTMESKISPIWWKDGNFDLKKVVQGYFATKIELIYTVSDLQGFVLDGMKYDFESNDRISILMDPKGELDYCDGGSRGAFGALIAVFHDKDHNFTYFADFPIDDPVPPNRGTYDAYCWDSDPQHLNNGSGTIMAKQSGRLLAHARSLQSFIKSPAKDRAQQARRDVEALQAALHHSHSHATSEANTALDELQKFVGNPSTVSERARPALITEVDDLVNIFHNGSGACRKAIVHLTP